MNIYLQSIQRRLGKWYVPLIASLFTILMLCIGYFSLQNNTQQDIRKNQVAPTTVLAPYTIEDNERTKLLREQAVSSVENVFAYQRHVVDQAQSELEQLTHWLTMMREESYSTASIREQAAKIESQTVNTAVLATDRDINKSVPFKELSNEEQKLVIEINYFLGASETRDLIDQYNVSTIQQLITMEKEAFVSLTSTLREQIIQILSQPITDSQLNAVIFELDTRTSNDAGDQLFIETIIPFIKPTVLYDEQATLKKRAEASENVQPTYILQGQVIVQEGHIVDGEDIRQLELYDYFNKSRITLRTITYSVLVLIHWLALIYFSFKFNDTKTKNKMTAYLMMFFSFFILTWMMSYVQSVSFDYLLLMLPINLFVTFLLPILGLNATLPALTSFLIFQIFPLTFFSDGMTGILLALYFILLSIFALWQYQQMIEAPHLVNHKTQIRLIVFSTILAITLFSLFNINFPLLQWVRILILIPIGHLLVWLFNTTIYPYWEGVFSNKAKLTLNELSTLNHPLLQELIEKAPGTYNHSMMVANLSSNAVNAIGGNGLLTRVACYYHDVGKMKRPLFFTENVSNKIASPHDEISPEESTKIIIDHVHEGVAILKQYHFPESVVDLCYEHHGTTLVKYFYHQARVAANNEEVDEALFRYDCRKPQSKEAAIMMIADTCEAASRTLKDYEFETISNLVNNLINDKILDNQFCDCQLTVHELKLVKQSLIKGIASMYHTRIDYPD